MFFCETCFLSLGKTNGFAQTRHIGARPGTPPRAAAIARENIFERRERPRLPWAYTRVARVAAPRSRARRKVETAVPTTAGALPPTIYARGAARGRARPRETTKNEGTGPRKSKENAMDLERAGVRGRRPCARREHGPWTCACGPWTLRDPGPADPVDQGARSDKKH